MWVDESGGTDTTETASDEMTISVGGEEYTADVNFDINEDGVNDTATIETEDGGVQAFVDKDGDGDADEYLQLDAQGEKVAHATYDEASGQWIDAGGAGTGPTGTDSQTGSEGTITADLPQGDVEVGPATVDTNEDGVNDTAVVKDEAGNTIGFTDVDGDGNADVAVVIDSSGNATTYEHTGDGQWTETQGGQPSGAVGDTGVDTSDAAWGGAGTDHVEGVAKIDPGTGQWISQN
ncbi:DUF6802 family protein [Amycolatopsis suaedae]|uniref:DUF6802 domain-containing protein n=1 Tax=Amycolatopsis suaedae TaxID=2510978 RepID=A0A4Q7JCP1_9PSEU|nr:DUF6802 family protein [Amycolatopsis suaedae]RZQ65087.1 hypothetical protein EWH70_04100 [Amycolatopsis suaedae]